MKSNFLYDKYVSGMYVCMYVCACACMNINIDRMISSVCEMYVCMYVCVKQSAELASKAKYRPLCARHNAILES